MLKNCVLVVYDKERKQKLKLVNVAFSAVIVAIVVSSGTTTVVVIKATNYSQHEAFVVVWIYAAL